MNNQQRSTLPTKELSLFKRVVKCYEQKQFKNGLKFAKQILQNPNFAEHGETLAMKGLILSCTGKRDDAYECVKKGIKNDINSSICWHVYGLVQKADRKYDEAMKCYVRALKMDKNNIQILRDLSLLQIQMRNFDGYLNTRSQLFQLRPSQKASWLGYVVSQQLLENYDEAIKILDEYKKVQQNIPPYNYEHSELLVYYASILMEAGRLKECIEFLKENQSNIVDKLYYAELLGEIYMKLNQKALAVEIYKKLIDRNPDNESYYMKLLESLGIESEDDKMSLFDELIVKYSRDLMPQWIPLKLLPAGEKFKKYADSFLKICLRKGVWALFVQLKFFYGDKEKVSILENLYESYKQKIIKYVSLEEDGPIEAPTTEIYINYLLAQHYSWLGKVKEALEIVDNQLKHTPTLIEFYSLKGRIYYDAGNVLMASKCLDEAQSMDTADRYINCVCTRYLIEAGRFKDAEEMAAKFTREGMRSLDNLNEMQCMWFLNTMARTNLKLKKYADALQKCHEVNKHFSMMVDDQFDFHSYCLRKTTLRSYVELLRTEDRLRNHDFYIETAKIAIKIYLHITDHPIDPENDVDNIDMNSLSISEAKKLKNKQRRQLKKAESEAAKKQAEQEKRDQIQKSKNQDKEEIDCVEEKIDGKKLIQTKSPLDEAIKFLSPLLMLSPNRLDTHILAYHVYEKKNKPLLLLKSIYKGYKIDGCINNPKFHECIVKFGLVLSELINNDEFKTVFNHFLPHLPYGIDKSKEAFLKKAKELNSNFLKRNSSSLLHNFYHWHINNHLHNISKAEALKEMNIGGVPDKWQDCEQIFHMLQYDYEVCEKDDVFQKLKSQFIKIYPYCPLFMKDDDQRSNTEQLVIIQPSHFNSPSNSKQLQNGIKESS